jgi:DNA invertase Pin-like site-specific DNA recombinase
VPIAYSYIRFSTIEQKKGDSLRRQTELSKRYAEQHNLTLDNSLHLHDLGLSAYDRSNVERGALGGFLEAIKQGRIIPGSYLLVESLDRLSRAQVLDALQVFISILNQGITIVTLADGMVYSKESVGSNFGNLIISIAIMARAHEESVTKSRRIRAAWKNKRENIADKKLTAQCPRWMQLVDNKTRFELIPERVNIVMEIIDLARTGMGQAQIAKRLNERRVSPFSNHGTGWHSSYIQKIVTSTALYGEMQPHVWESGKVIPHGEPIADYYPALLTKEEFLLLQNVRSERVVGGGKAKKGTTAPNLLSGIVKCGYCGRSMILAGAAAMRVRVGDEGKPKRFSHKVLLCDGGRRGLGCYAVQWSYKDFEKSFLMFCRSIDLAGIMRASDQSAATKEKHLSVSEKLQATCSAIIEAQKRLEHLVTIAESGEASPAAILNRIRERESELQILTETKNRLDVELQAAKVSSKNRENQIESIHKLVNQLENMEGDQLFKARVALAEHIRRSIEVVKMYPAGMLKTPDEIQRIRHELIADGFALDQVDAYIAETYRTSPKRQGRGGRGRYASRREMGRYFTIKAKDGGFRVVHPNFDDPSVVVIEMSINGG